ncbi:hypothetical protein V2J09_011382 [Rumex salicifolius]
MKLPLASKSSPNTNRGVVQGIVLYVPPSPTKRWEFWRDLEQKISHISEPVFMGGDYNCIVDMAERQGGALVCLKTPKSLQSGLTDLTSSTWGIMAPSSPRDSIGSLLTLLADCNGRKQLFTTSLTPAPTTIRSSFPWRASPKATEIGIPPASKQHGLSTLISSRSSTKSGATPLRLTQHLPSPDRTLPDGIERKDKLQALLMDIQQRLGVNPTEQDAALDAALEAATRSEFETTLAQGEILWYQKAKETWMELGDRNTEYFHTSVSIHCRRNKILTLRGHDGGWILDQGQLESHVVQYYRQLYTLPGDERKPVPFFSGGFSPLSTADVVLLSKPLANDEVYTTLNHMVSYKAPGRGWKGNSLSPIFPASTLLRLAATGLSDELNHADNICWGPSKSERHRRHMSASPTYQLCGRGGETLIHLCRDCPQARATWLLLLPVTRRGIFFTVDPTAWAHDNLLGKIDFGLEAANSTTTIH